MHLIVVVFCSFCFSFSVLVLAGVLNKKLNRIFRWNKI